MIGTKQRMPKWARYPVFLVGLVVILVGSIGAHSIGAAPSTIAGITGGGFALLFLSVAIK